MWNVESFSCFEHLSVCVFAAVGLPGLYFIKLIDKGRIAKETAVVIQCEWANNQCHRWS